MKKLLSLIVITAAYLTATAQPTFQKFYGGLNSLDGDVGYSIQQTSDGGYIVTGHTYNFGAQAKDILLMKLNATGDTLWTKMYGGLTDDNGYSVIQTLDGGYVIAGSTFILGNGVDVLVIKTNSSGDVQWMKNFGGTSNDGARSVIETADSNLIIAGMTESYGAGASDAYLIATNNQGDTLWTKTYGGSQSDELHSVAQCITGGYIMAGYSDSWGTNSYIIRTDNNGDTLWTKVLAGIGDDYAYSIEQTPSDSGFIFGGTYGVGISDDMFMAKLDSVGGFSWSKTYGGGGIDKCYAVRQTADGGYIMAGESSSGLNGNQFMFVVKTDAIGDTLWTRFLGEDFYNNMAHDVQLTNDGGYVVGGFTADIFSTAYKVYIVKLDSNGLVDGCHQFPTYSSTTSPTPSTDGPTPSLVGNGSNIGTPAITTTSVSPSYTEFSMYLSFDSTGVSCNGDSIGTATVIVNCGVPPFTYLWETGSINDSINGLFAGIYSVTVTSANGKTAVDSVAIPVPAVLFPNAYLMDFTFCDSLCTGIAEAMANGGTSPYTYAWSDLGSQTDMTATGLCIGTYFVTVTDGNGCIAVDSMEMISDPVPPLFLNNYVEHAACITACNGVVAVTAIGVAPFTYLWDDPGSQTADTAKGICVGQSVVKVWDGQGCVVFDTINVGAIGDTMSLQAVTGYDVTCNIYCNGSTVAWIIGNIPGPYVYLWNDPQAQTTQGADSLCAGTYSVTFSDTNGCFSFTDSVTVGNSYQSNDIQFNYSQPACAGICDGEITAILPQFPISTFIWDDPQSQTTPTADSLCSGFYTLITIDDLGCTKDTDTITLFDVVPVISLSTSSTNVICNGICDGTASVTATGTYPPMSYLWNDPGSQTGAGATGLCPGTFTVNVTDSAGCITVMDSITVDTDPFTPEPICVITVDSTSTKNVIVWEKPVTAGIDSIRIYRDIIGTYTHIASQEYSVISYYEDTTSGINPNITAYKYKISTVDTCGVESALSSFHKSIHLQVVPGVPPAMELSWNDYEGFSFTFYRILRDSTGLGGSNWEKIDSTSFGINTLSDPNPPQTASLRYLVEVVAPSVCIADKAKNFNSSKSNSAVVSDPLSISTSSTLASIGVCDASATATGSGGITPYTYLWNTVPAQTTATATGLCGNTTYTVTVTDAASDNANTSVTISEMTGIGEDAVNSLFDLYPNPNGGSFTIDMRIPGVESWKLKIFNILGSEIWSENLGVVNGNMLKSIDLRQEDSGVYYIQLYNDHVTLRRKVVIY